MKSGDRVLFTGWRIIADGTRTIWVELVPAILTGIDRLSQIGSYPDRYSIRFEDDGTEQDTVRQCLAACRLGATPEADLRRSPPGEEAHVSRGQSGTARQGAGAENTRRPQPGDGK